MTEDSSLKFSIALCTCNGERFLAEQLDSLANQNYLPAELVICDDASDDGTCSLLQGFASRAPFPVRLHRNPHRLGIGANFEQAIRLCTGNFVAICDQDDVWLPNKLEVFAEALGNGMDWVCCDAEVCDADLHSLGYTMWQRVNFDQQERKAARDGQFLDVLTKHFVVAGATLAFRTQVRDRLLPIPTEWHYDAWLAAVLAATSRGTLAEMPLQRYRQHGGNAVGAARRGLWSEVQAAFSLERGSYYRAEISRWSRLAAHLEGMAPEPMQARLAGKLAHLRCCASLPANRLARLSIVMAEAVRGGYGRYARNWGSIAFDLLIR